MGSLLRSEPKCRQAAASGRRRGPTIPAKSGRRRQPGSMRAEDHRDHPAAAGDREVIERFLTHVGHKPQPPPKAPLRGQDSTCLRTHTARHNRPPGMARNQGRRASDQQGVHDEPGNSVDPESEAEDGPRERPKSLRRKAVPAPIGDRFGANRAQLLVLQCAMPGRQLIQHPNDYVV